MKKDKFVVYAVMAHDSRFGDQMVTVYSDPVGAFKHAKVLFNRELVNWREKEQKGLGEIRKVDENEMLICWNDKDTDDEWKWDIKISYWVKSMYVYNKCQVE